MPQFLLTDRFIQVGEAIKVVQNDNPSQEEIDNVHRKYCEGLQKCFDEGKNDPILPPGWKQKLLILQ